MDLNALRKQLHARLPDVIGDLRTRAANHGPDVPREAGFTIRDAADDDTVAVVRIYDEIWWLGVSADDLVRQLDGIDKPSIRVEINSPGGDVFDGIAIYNALRAHPAEVETRVDGVAASIASVIAQAGDRRVVMGAGQVMVHNAWGVTIGDAGEHDEMADLLRQQDEVIAGIYARRSGRDIDNFRQLMAAETWLTAEQAVAEGLADEVVDPPSKTSSASSRATLHDEIREAVDAVDDVIVSVERVAALRAEAGKDLSVRNRDSLDGLAACLRRLDELLGNSNGHDDNTVDVVNEYARFVALTQEIAA